MGEGLTPQTGFLSSILHDATIIHKADVPADWFTAARYKNIYKTILDLDDRDVEIDVAAVGAESDAGAVVAIYDLLPTGANWKYYKGELEKEYLLRELEMLANSVHDGVNAKQPEKVITDIEQRLLDLQRPSAGEVVKICDLMRPVIDKIEERFNSHGMPGLSTGIPELNNLTLGLQKRRYYVIGARPSHGKSALIHNVARHLITKDVPVGLITLESGGVEVIMRMLSDVGSIPQKDMQTGDMKQYDFDNLSNSASKIYDKELYIYDKPNAELEEVKSVARRMVRVHGVEAIFIDYVQLIKYGDFSTPQHERIGAVSVAMKELARQLDVPIITAAQLNRGGDDTPGISALKGSGQIEQDADVVIIIEHVIEAGEDAIYLHVAKNRDGETGRVPVIFTGPYTRFSQRPERG